MKLDGQVAVITGSGRGIGRAIALAYAREGAKLALAARNESELQEAVSAASELGAEAIAVRTDVTSQQDTERLAHRVVERFGRIDVLVNNAGNSGPIGPLQGNDIADWVNTVNVNLTGTFLVCRAVIPVDPSKPQLFVDASSRDFFLPMWMVSVGEVLSATALNARRS